MENEEKEDLKKEIKTQADYEGLANTAGGKRLIESLQRQIKGSLEALCAGYREMPLQEMITLVARISERIEILKTLSNASTKKKEAQERYDFLIKPIKE